MRGVVIAGLLALAACGGSEVAEEIEADTPPVETAETLEETSPGPAPEEIALLAAGDYCYFHEDEIATEALEIHVAGDGSIAGSHYGEVHDEANAYFTSFDTALSNGQPGADGAIVFQTVTEVEGDTQTGDQIWTLTPEAASMADFDPVFTPAECDGLMNTIWPPIE
ncbi:MAG: hypothetical protein MRY64_07615 [Hyphomonadaceae bacterium]|nr:hypothetical protein [Hyphomonadaceae bacterium]